MSLPPVGDTGDGDRDSEKIGGQRGQQRGPVPADGLCQQENTSRRRGQPAEQRDHPLQAGQLHSTRLVPTAGLEPALTGT